MFKRILSVFLAVAMLVGVFTLIPVVSATQPPPCKTCGHWNIWEIHQCDNPICSNCDSYPCTCTYCCPAACLLYRGLSVCWEDVVRYNIPLCLNCHDKGMSTCSSDCPDFVCPCEIYGGECIRCNPPIDYEIVNGKLIKYNGPAGAVVIPEGVTSIGYSAFGWMYDDKYTSITLPQSIGDNIEEVLFLSSVAEIHVHPDNETFSSVDGVLFNKDGTTLLCFPRGKTGDYIIPNGVTHIEYGAFSESKASSVTIPDSVTHIGGYAFSRTAFSSITIPASVVEIGSEAFDSRSDDTFHSIIFEGKIPPQMEDFFDCSCSSVGAIYVPAGGSKAAYMEMLVVEFSRETIGEVIEFTRGANGEIVALERRNFPNFIAPIAVIDPNASEFADWTAISDRAGLEAIADNLSGKYYLTNDIDLSDEEWVPIGGEKNPFTGIFDGQGYVIRNMTITRTYNELAGLFGCISKAEVRNVGMEDTDINIDSTDRASGKYSVYAGSIAGIAENGASISNCYNTGDVIGYSGYETRVGGILGEGYVDWQGYSWYEEWHRKEVDIEYCYNTGNITGYSNDSTDNGVFVAGISTGTDVSYSFNTGDITAYGRSGSIPYYASGIGIGMNILRCFNSGGIYSDKYAFGIGGEDIWDSYNVGNVVAGRVASGVGGGDSNAFVGYCYNAGEVSIIQEGDGRFYDDAVSGGIAAYLYSSDYLRIYRSYNNSDKTVNGIGASQISDDHREINVTNLTTAQMQDASNFSAFDFEKVWTIIEGVNDGMPVLRAFEHMYAPVEPVPAVRHLPNFIAPIEIIDPNASEFADWTAISDRAGLESIADNPEGKYYLTNDIDLSGEEWTPIGDYDNPFTGIFDGQGYVIRNMTITGEFAGGYLGLFSMTVDASIRNVGFERTNIDIEVVNPVYSTYVGAVVGAAWDSYDTTVIYNCYNTGNISVYNITGTVGINILGTVSAGGITGEGGVISHCYNTGDIFVETSVSSATFVAAGGISGSFAHEVKYSFNTGDIFGKTSGWCADIGGIVGSGDWSKVYNSYNSGNITADSAREANAGGIFGYAEDKSKVWGCYNTGDIVAISYSDYEDHDDCLAGGIAGYFGEAVYDSYSTGNVSVAGERGARYAVGGLLGRDYGYIENCYWNSDADQTLGGNPQDPKRGIGMGDRSGAAPLTSAQMQDASNFSDFDFKNVWTIIEGVNDGMPVLRAFEHMYAPVEPDLGNWDTEEVIDRIWIFVAEEIGQDEDGWWFNYPVNRISPNMAAALEIGEIYDVKVQYEGSLNKIIAARVTNRFGDWEAEEQMGGMVEETTITITSMVACEEQEGEYILNDDTYLRVNWIMASVLEEGKSYRALVRHSFRANFVVAVKPLESVCEECGEEDCSPCTYCGECSNTHICDPLFIPGDVDGSGVIGIGDALEILKYLAGMTSVVSLDNSVSWNAARITGGEIPGISDVLEILKFLAGMKSLLTEDLS